MLSGRRLLLTENNEGVHTISYKSVETELFDGVTYPENFVKRYGPYISR